MTKPLFGGLLIAAGVLIATLSGLCTLLLGAPFLSISPFQSSDALLALALFGGAPFALGVGLIVLGVYLMRPDKPRPNTPALRVEDF